MIQGDFLQLMELHCTSTFQGWLHNSNLCFYDVLMMNLDGI